MSILSFGEFRLDPINKRLWQGERAVELGSLPFAVLCHLIERSAQGHLVTKRELRERIWGSTHVSDEAIRGCVSVLRKALGDDPHEPRFIKTHSKEGFRFLLPVAQAAPPSATPSRAPQPPNGPYDPAWYVERPQEEKQILGCLESPGRPVVVFGPQGSGKTTLIRRALQAAKAETSSRVLWISLRALSEAHLESLDSMLRELGRLLLDPFGEDEERAQAVLAPLWARSLVPALKFKQLVRSHVCSSASRVYLIFSEVECLASWRHQSAWLDMLRAWQDAEELSSLRLLLETSIPPRQFPLGGGSPLWTKARRIDATELSALQIAQMAALYGMNPSTAACQQLGELVGGLAGLCRHALYQAAVRGVALESILAEVQPARRQFGVFTEPLQDLQQWLDLHMPPKSTPGERSVNHRLIPEGGQRIALRSEEAWPLLRKGILREAEPRGSYRLRCCLYEDFFGGRSS